jgi:molybdate transport system ATP-binding protein
VTWVIQGDGFQVNPLLTEDAATDNQQLVLHAHVSALRSLGEISLATVALDEPEGTQLQLTLSGTQRQNVQTGQQISVSMDCRWIHVMPVRR